MSLNELGDSNLWGFHDAFADEGFRELHLDVQRKLKVYKGHIMVAAYPSEMYTAEHAEEYIETFNTRIRKYLDSGEQDFIFMDFRPYNDSHVIPIVQCNPSTGKILFLNFSRPFPVEILNAYRAFLDYSNKLLDLGIPGEKFESIFALTRGEELRGENALQIDRKVREGLRGQSAVYIPEVKGVVGDRYSLRLDSKRPQTFEVTEDSEDEPVRIDNLTIPESYTASVRLLCEMILEHSGARRIGKAFDLATLSDGDLFRPEVEESLKEPPPKKPRVIHDVSIDPDDDVDISDLIQEASPKPPES